MFARSSERSAVLRPESPPDLTATSPIVTPSMDELLHNVPSYPVVASRPKPNESLLRNDQVKNHLKRPLQSQKFIMPRPSNRVLPNSLVPAYPQNVLRKIPRIEKELDRSRVNITIPTYEHQISDIWDMQFWKTEIDSFLVPVRDLYTARAQKLVVKEEAPVTRTMDLNLKPKADHADGPPSYSYAMPRDQVPWLVTSSDIQFK
jgi:hypothetical protein